MTTATAIAGYRPGDHVCQPFLGDVQRDAALIPFLREGLLRGERCLYAALPAALAQAEDSLRDAGVDVARARARRALVLSPADETYGAAGRLDQERTLAFIGAAIDDSLAEGFTGVRGVGEIGRRLLDSELGPLRAYELRVNEMFATRPFTALCSFSLAHVTEHQAQALLAAHPQAWVDGDICSNHFFHADADAHAHADTARGAPPTQTRASREIADMLRQIQDHDRTSARDRRFLTALALEAGALARSLDQRLTDQAGHAGGGPDGATRAHADDDARRDAALVDSLDRHLHPLRDELRSLRRALRDGQAPPPADLLGSFERIGVQLRGLVQLVRARRRTPGRPQ